MIDFDKLKQEQAKLSVNLILKDEFKKVEKIAGIDQVYIGDNVISCMVVCDAKTLEPIETATANAKAPIQYKPGFLAYRDLPAMIAAYNKLKNEPDVILVDGHGIAHPRRCGLASHFGLVMNKPTIGVAKSLIIGSIENHKVYIGKDLVAVELITKEHASPIYVSPGHMISIGTAAKIVKDSLREPHKLPEPLHLAHRGARREMKIETKKR